MDHHFVPQFYLRAFRDPAVPEGQEPWVWVADLKERTVERRAPKNVGKKASYYAFPEFDEESPETIEQLFSRIESAAAPIARKLLQAEFELNEQEWADLLFFAAFFVGRAPFFRNQMEQMSANISKFLLQTAASIPEYFEETLRKARPGEQFTPQEVEALRRWILDDSKYTIRESPIFSLGIGVELAFETIYPLFREMHWGFLKTDSGGHFITCDSPVSWFDPTPRPPIYGGHGLAMRNVEVTFPIGPELCLLGTWEGPIGLLDAPSAAIEEFNRRRAAFADRYIFADTEAGARWALETR